MACTYPRGRYKRMGHCRFAHIVMGELKLHPLHIYQKYQVRFGIESSYRLVNLVRVRTTSLSAALRLLHLGVALMMLNLRVFVKWTCVARPPRSAGPVANRLLPLARWRLWLWEVAKQHQGFNVEILVPLTA